MKDLLPGSLLCCSQGAGFDGDGLGMPGHRYTGFISIEHRLPLSNRPPAKSFTVHVHLRVRNEPLVQASVLLPL
jgi:hypothetical protein